MNTIILDGHEFKIVVEYKNNKNMYMRLKIDNIILITCGYNVPIENIHSFINSKKEWILKARLRLIEKKENQNTPTINESSVKLLGKKYQLIIKDYKYDSFEIVNNQILISSKSGTSDSLNEVFYSETSKMLLSILKQQRVRWDKMLDNYNLAYPNITLKSMRGKWGSCTPSKNKINMNHSLITTPIECIDYVLLHEYVHLIVPNHSKRFYDVVLYHMPNYKELKKKLNEI